MRAEEEQRLRATFARRAVAADSRYDPFAPAVYMAMQERERALIRLLHKHLLVSRQTATVLEVGCGTGTNLLELIRLGFDPARLTGNELIPERISIARRRLPELVRLVEGNFLDMEVGSCSYDIVYQSTVFTSILDGPARKAMAARMWELVRSGGGVLWYDFTVDNPRNRDVRGIRIREVRQLFPEGSVDVMRVTLAPPVARFLARMSPSLYTIARSIPPLRTHVLCWIQK